VTLHRPALVDGPELGDVMSALEQLSREMPVIFPVHPRTRRGLDRFAPGGDGLRLVDPIGYIDFLALESNARAVLTDSGGIQEESTFLGVPCFTMRNNTERPITIEQGTNRLIGTNPGSITDIPALLDDVELPRRTPDLWDGRAAERGAAVLLGDLRAERVRPAQAIPS
jgi:UDP-N-acetylglucosamine 2-epimerase (non-hydrolysing)